MKSDERDLAYVLYTSGSTGKPKGVLIEHRGITSLVKNTSFIDLRESDNLLMTGAFIFDISTFEVWGPLLNGLTLHLVDRQVVLDPFKLGEYIQQNKITILHLIPQLFNQVYACNIEVFKKLRYFLIGGDLVRPKYLNDLRNECTDLKICHMYGPTENTTFSTSLLVEKTYKNTLPIGKPIDYSNVYIFNKWNELQPIGIPGEIYVGGAGIARGYLNKEDLTKANFIANPYLEGEKIYKTGDYGRWLADGTLEFLGRRDKQVKVRGSRLEIGEIEQKILEYDDISQVIVLVKGGNEADNSLVAYFVADKEIKINELKAFMAKALPEYMIPSSFISIDTVPMTPNGKVDESALLALRNYNQEEYVAPENEIEEQLAVIWAEVLALDSKQISVTADFFELGGHSLKVTILTSKIYKALQVKVSIMDFFEVATIRKLAEYISVQKQNNVSKINKVTVQEQYPLSSAQRRLYFLQTLDKSSTAYNMSAMYNLTGKLNKELLEESFKKLVDRHESLHTIFLFKDGQLGQKVLDDYLFNIEYFKATQDQIEDIITQFTKPFDLSKLPLMRIGVVELEVERYMLLVDLHHIIADAVSTQVLVKELFELYNGQQLEKVEVTYKDYTIWQIDKKESLTNERQYWLNDFENGVPELNMVTDFKRPEIQNFEGERIRFKVNKEKIQLLNEMALSNDATLYMVLMSAYFVMLNKLSGQNDLVVGTVTSGRTHPDVENIVGMFANTLPIHINIDPSASITSLINNVKNKVLGAIQNQEYQFEDLIDELNIERNTNRNPLFDTMFSYEVGMDDEIKLPGITVKPYEYLRHTSKFDFTLFVKQEESDFVFEFEYCTKLYKATTVERMAHYYERIINCFLEGIDQVKEISLLTTEEEQAIKQNNSNQVVFSENQTIQALFEKCVLKTPDNIAIQSGKKEITYKELKVLSDKVAAQLEKLNVKKGDVVAVMMPQCEQFIISILGILKVGATYLPIDPTLPEARIRFMIQDSNTRVVLVQENISIELPDEVVCANVNAADFYEIAPKDFIEVGNSEDIIYIIYTSGTTGNPKGCLIKQKGVVNYIEWAIKQYFEDEHVYFPFYSSVAFDLTVTSIFTPLISSNTVVVYPKEMDVLNRIVEENISTIIKVTPTHLRLLLDLDCSNSSIKKIIVGGEQLTTELAQKIYDKFNGEVEIFNEYGPTETVVGCMIHKYDPSENDRVAVPIGEAIQNMTVYLLDEQGNVCPPNVIGEIYIDGVGVSPGYLNNSEMNKKCFVLSLSNSTLYKTGDLGIYLEDGKLEYVGRKDKQIKLRGYRIEIEEIERQILECKDVKNVAVVIKERGSEDQFLCAYILSDSIIDEEVIKKSLKTQLPEYMIPSYFVQIESFPIAASGKLDTESLPMPTQFTEVKEEVNLELMSQTEQEIYEVWTQYLGITNIQLDDNFFDLGGNSFLLMKMHQQLNKTYNFMKITDFFKYKTISELASYIKSQETVEKLEQMSFGVQFAEEYFNVTNNIRKANSYRFLKPELRNQDVMSIIDKHKLVVEEIYIALLGFTLSQITGEKQITLNMPLKKGNCDRYCLDVNYEDYKEMNDLFEGIHRQIKEPVESRLYNSKDYLQVAKKKHDGCANVFISMNDTGAVSVEKNIPYDLVVTLDDNVGEFEVSFNNELLNGEKLQDLISIYARFLNNILCK